MKSTSSEMWQHVVQPI